LASALCGNLATTAGAGTTHTDFALLPLVGLNVVTGANNSGVGVPPGNGSGDGMSVGDSMVVYNSDANTILLYPPLGGQLNAGTVTTGTVSIPTHTSVTVTAQTNLLFIVSGPTT
jgi:hypothetical protein